MSQTESIDIDLSGQQLHYYRDGELRHSYPISSARNGAGELRDSEMTPRGRHYIRAKIGAGLPANAVLVGRRFSGEVFNSSLQQQYPQRDWILSRILWLCGLEPGKNRLGQVDSMRRYIYIHGTPDSEPMGVPESHGCIRMRNQDIIALFDQVTPGCAVTIYEQR